MRLPNGGNLNERLEMTFWASTTTARLAGYKQGVKQGSDCLIDPPHTP